MPDHSPDDFVPAWRSRQLDTVLEGCWQLIAQAARQAREPMHVATLGSLDGGAPSARSVVLRRASVATRELLCHTDARSPKLIQLEADARVAWLFYDAPRKLQFALRGVARVHRADALSANWVTP